MNSRLFRGLLALSLLGMSQAAWAADPSTVTDPALSTDRIIAPKGKPKLLKNPTFISIKMNNTDVRAVLEVMAQKAGMNLLFDDSVQGKVTINLRATPLDEALSLVMKMTNLTYKRVGSSLMVGSVEALKKKGFVADETRALRVNNTTPDDAIAKIQALMGSVDVKLEADKRTNSIYVAGSEDSIARVRGILEAIDVPTPQVMIEVKLVEISSSKVDQLGVNYGFGGGKIGAGFNNTNNDTASSGQAQSGNPATGGGSSLTFSAMGNFTANFNARLDALILDNSATVLANPRVFAQDSQKASIKIVNKHPVVKTTTTQTGTSQDVQFENVGQTLDITPRIDSKGFVTLELKPEISARTQDVIVNGNPVPVIDSRTVETKVRVANDESVVIGGLKRRDETNSIGKVPLLGDLPLLGSLFRYQTKNRADSEIIIVVTPHIQTKLSEEDTVSAP